jgi:hypothetical protein
MTPDAPERFSTIICWPRVSESFAATSRPTTSTLPPGGNGETRRIDFDGYCASALVAERSAARARSRIVMARM